MAHTHLVQGTIAAGQSLSNAVDCSQGDPAVLIMPDGWTPADLTFQVSFDGTNFYDLFDPEDREVRLTCNGLARALRLPQPFSLLVNHVKFRSGRSGLPVPQQAARTFTIALLA